MQIKKDIARFTIMLRRVGLIATASFVLAAGAQLVSSGLESVPAEAHTPGSHDGNVTVHLKKTDGTNANFGGIRIRLERLDGSNENCGNGNERDTDGNGDVTFTNCDTGPDHDGRDLRVKIKSDFREVFREDRWWISADDEKVFNLNNNENEEKDLSYEFTQQIRVDVRPPFNGPTVPIHITRIDNSYAGDDCLGGAGATTKSTDLNGETQFTCKATNSGRQYRLHNQHPTRNWNGANWLVVSQTKDVALFRANPQFAIFDYKVQCATSTSIFFYDYIIPAPADCFPDAKADNSGTQMNFLLSAGGPDSRPSTLGYVPNQFIVASSQPRFSFELRGGSFNQGDFYDNSNNPPAPTIIANSEGFDSPVYYEVYQLQDMGPQDGVRAGKFLGAINPRDRGVFPGIDTSPASHSCSSGDCWRKFSIDTNGGAVRGDGSAQQQSSQDGGDYLRARFSPVDAGVRLNSPPGNGGTAGQPGAQGTNPNYNGMYAFLIKQVHYQDIRHGYVTSYSTFNDSVFASKHRAVCPVPVDGSQVTCPSALLSHPLGSFNGHYVRNGYYVRSERFLPGGGRQFLATAPANLSIDIGWGPAGGGQQYGEFYNEPYRGLHFSAGGAGCRNDEYSKRTLPNFIPGVWAPNTGPNPQFRFANADFGRGSPANPSMFIFAPFRFEQVQPFFLSDNWTDGLWNASLDDPLSNGGAFNPRWLANELDWGGFEIRGWNEGNEIYYGAPSFSSGQQPTCYRPVMTPITPKNVGQGYQYNGIDARTVLFDNTVDSRLRTVFAYQLPGSPTTAPENRTSAWVTEVRQDPANPTPVLNSSGTHAGQSSQQHAVINADLQAASLAPNTTYYWRACAKGTTNGHPTPPHSVALTQYAFSFNLNTLGDTDEIWNCTTQSPFRVNHGPTARVRGANPPSGPNSQIERCFQLSVQLRDPESDADGPGGREDKVTPLFTFAWADGDGRNHQVKGNGRSGDEQLLGNSGDEFTAGQLQVDEYTIDGNAQTVDRDQSMMDFMREKAPRDRRVNFVARGEDRFGASDLHDLGRFFLAQEGFPSGPLATEDNNGAPLEQWSTGFKAGPPTTVSILIGPYFRGQSSKKFYDTNGNELQTVTDGQTVRVVTRIVNGGESPANFYEIRDYLGSTKDFERPTDIQIDKNGGPEVVIPAADPENRLQIVRPRKDGDDTVFGDSLPPDSPDYRGSAWRVDLGDSQAGLLSRPEFGGPGNVLNPGDVIQVRYNVRANRDQHVTKGDDTVGDFDTTRLDPATSYFFIRYQEETCDPSNLVIDTPDLLESQVAAPWLRTRRGSIGSNQGIFGYNSGQDNATFLIQANGQISHFNSATATKPNYSNPNEVCAAATDSSGRLGETAGGIDWRREMIANITRLNEGPKNNSNLTRNRLLGPGNGVPRGDLNGPQGNVWMVGSPSAPENLTIENSTAFSGTGTIVVYGDLNISDGVNLTYAPDGNGVNSLGVIVMGNLNIGANVTNLAGSYYVSDVDFNPAPIVNGCPNIKNGRGTISTGSSSLQLNVQGLMVARQFNLERYFLDPNPDAVNDPAEDIYYDGRVLASTPPGFATFRQTSAWYEIAP